VRPRLGQYRGGDDERIPARQPGQGGAIPPPADPVRVQYGRRPGRDFVLELPDRPGLMAGDAGEDDL